MLSEQILIFFQIIFIDLVLAGDNASIIGMVASQFPAEQRKKIIFWGIGAAVVLRILFTLITAYLLQISGLRLIGGILLLYICYKLYVDVVKQQGKEENIKIIIRTGVGSQRPLHPQHQHIGDFTESIKKMCTTIDVIKLMEPEDIFPAYEKAFTRTDGRNTLIVEFGDYYNEK